MTVSAPGSSCSRRGATGRKIAHEVGSPPKSLSKWRFRILELGLEDAERSGRPLVYRPTDRLVLMAKITSELPEFTAQWSHFELHQAMAAAGIAISASQIGRILAAHDVRPHKVEGWLTRKDSPELWERAADVCGLYLAPPENAVVLSIDEKTGIQGKSRKHPTTMAASGRPARREFGYKRHGTASLLASLGVATGKVTAPDIARNDSATFISFLEEINLSIEASLAIHVVLDNSSSHTSKATRLGPRSIRDLSSITRRCTRAGSITWSVSSPSSVASCCDGASSPHAMLSSRR